MTQLPLENLRQHADYTHKYNRKTGRHGWLRLTPAYSVRIVEQLMAEEQGRLNVFDPFCGTATTALSAAYHGHNATTTDINPFLVWLGKAKTAHYSNAAIVRTRKSCDEIIRVVETGEIRPSASPPIHNIERWWHQKALAFLCQVHAGLDEIVALETDEATLLRIAFCRTLIACSNASFNHQSMSFKDVPYPEIEAQTNYIELFRENVNFVLQGAAENPEGTVNVFLHDARALGNLETAPVDLVITSPPYANRMSYIRELRPYMYWLGYLKNGRDAGDLDWAAIGGTWGMATSRLSSWKMEEKDYTSNDLEMTLARIASPNNPNGPLLSAYVHRYCVDMAKHFSGIRAVLAPGARLHYIVGNSTFYGELLSVEKIYAHIMADLGFTEIDIRPIRKRNSKKELVEYDVSAKWQSI